MINFYACLENLKQLISKAMGTGKTRMPAYRERLKNAIFPHTIHKELKPEFTKQNLLQMQTITKATKITKGFNRWMMTLVIAVLALTTSISTNAQIGVTVTGETNTTPALSTSYTTLLDALNGLNAVNAMTGPVTLTLAAGASETAPLTGFTVGSTTLNPVLSATNTVTIVKAAGAATVLNAAAGGTATPASPAPNGILKIVGADYITIDGLTLTDGNTGIPAAMEFGIALFKASLSDGAQNNTIQNCTINMQRINNTTGTAPMVEGSVGILMINSTDVAATTALAPTTAAGTNSNNKFYANTINSGNYGMALIGFAGATPFTTCDQGTIVGASTLGNTIQNFGGGAATNASAGIRTLAQYGISIAFNTVNNNTGAGVNHATTLRGIFVNTAISANATITNNTVSIRGGGTTSLVSAIDNASGSTAASNTISITNNAINIGYQTATTGVYNGIINSGTATTLNITGNTITQIAGVALAGTGTCVMIETGSPVTANANNNTIVNINRTGASGSWRGIKTTSPTNFNANNNTIENLSWITLTSTGSFDGIYSFSSAVNVTANNNIIRNLSTPTTGTITGITEFGVTGLKTFQNNQIYNFSTTAGGAGGASFRGISESTGSTNDFSGNQIYALNSTGTTGGTGGTMVGIVVSSGTINNIYKNRIYDISTTSTGATVNGITVSGGTTTNMYNNLVGNLSAPALNAANSFNGINISGGTTSNVSFNTVYLNATSSGAVFGSSAISASTTPTLNLRNNILVNLSAPNTTGLTVAYRRSSTTLTTYGSSSNNNFFYAGTPGAGNLIYNDGTNSDQTISAYKTRVSPRDNSSVSEIVSSTPGVFFQSFTGANTGFLHMVNGLTTLVESGGTAIPGISDDYDGETRNATTPDIGADEFNGTSPAPSVTFNSITPSTTQCVATSRLVSVTATTPAGTTITSVTITYNNGGGSVTFPMANTSGNIWEYTIPAALPTNTVVTWSATATNSIALTATYVGASYQDDPLFGGVGSATASPATICTGSTSNLTATFLMPNQSKTVGTGGSTSTTTAASFFPGGWGGAKTQYIITAAELTAAGLGAGNITSLSFETTNSGQTYQGFTVQMGHTAQSVMTTSFIALGLTQVYKGTLTDDGYTPLVGVNALAFGTGAGSSASFTWDGISNIVISICWSRVPAATTATATSMIVVPAGFTSSAYEQSDSETPAAMCGKTTADGTGTNRPKFTFVGNGVVPMASVTWNDGTSNIGTGNPFAVNPTANTTYTPTGTDANGCTLVAATGATVSVLALPSAPGTGSFPSSQCGSGVPGQPGNTAFVTGGSAGQYRWYTFDGVSTYTLIPGETGASLTTYSISATTTLYVAINDGTCESAKTAVVANVTAPDAITAVATPASVCANAPLDLTITQAGSNQVYTFTWTATPAVGSGIPTSVVGAPVTGLATVTPTAGGTYTYLVTAQDGACNTSSTVNVTVTAAPVINTPTAVPSTICEGQSSVLTATINIIANQVVTLGTGTTTTTGNTTGVALGPNPLQSFYGGTRQQMLILPSELTGLGLVNGSVISSIAFNLNAVEARTLQNYKVKMQHSALAAFANTSFINTGFTTVRNAADFTPVAGWNTIALNSNFTWDGTSSLLIDISFSNVDGGGLGTNSAFYSTTAFTSSLFYRVDNTAAATVEAAATATNSYSQRNNIRLGATVVTQGAGSLNWSWDNGGGTGNSVTVTPAASILYTVTAVDPATTCSNTATVNVTVLPLPDAPVGANSQQCGTGVPTASVTSGGVNGSGVFKWYLVPSGGTAIAGESGTALLNYTISTPTSFYVSEVGTNGCESPRTQVDVTFDLIPDDLTLSASPSPICLDQPTTFTVGQTGGNNSFVFNYPSLSHVAGSGINIPNIGGVDSSLLDGNITITPTAAGTYTYTVRGFDPDKGCISVASTTVTVNPLPNITSTFATPATICEGLSTTLSAQSISSASGAVTLGAGANTTTLSTAGTPYRMGNIVGNQFKNQYLFLASELQAQGLLAGNITSVQLTIAGTGGGTLSNFTINMGTTAQTVMTTTYVTGLSTVLSLATYPATGNVTTGVQTHTFTAPFAWDGTSNIVLEMCAQLATTGSSGTLAGDNLLFNASIFHTASTTGCTSTSGASVSATRPKVTFGGTVGTNFTNDYIWVWNNGGGSGSTVTVAPTTTTSYNVTATRITTGCQTVSSPDITVTVNPAPLAPTSDGDVTRCGPGAVSISATAAGGGTLKWYAVSTGGTSVFTGSPYNLSNVTGNTSYWVSETNTTTGCEGPRTQVNITINTPPTLAITPGGATTFCQGGFVQLNASSASSSSYINFAWTPSTGLTNAIFDTTTAAPSVTTIYTVTADDGAVNGCSNTATITVNINPNPVIVSATATPSTSCVSGNVVLTATTNVIGAGTAALGTATTTTSTAGITPYNSNWEGSRTQYLLRASELTAIGLSAGNISSLAFDVTAAGVGTFAQSNFSIKIAHTAETAFSGAYATPTGSFTTVVNPTTVGAPTVGINTFTFDAPFVWDGISNVVIDVCHDNDIDATCASCFSGSSTVKYTATSFNSVYGRYNDNAQACGVNASSVVTTFTNRPNMIIGGQVSTTGAGTLNWVWNPGSLVGNSVTVSPTVNTDYTVTATNTVTNCVTTSAQIPVTILPVVAAASASPSAICIGGSSTLSAAASTGGSPLTYAWRVQGNATVLGTAVTLSVNPTATTVYEITVTDPCLNTSVQTTIVTVNPLPTASIAEPGVTLCTPASQTLTAVTDAASPIYQWKKNALDISGETAGTLVLNTVSSGNYTVVITEAATGCFATSSTVSVTINQTPDAVSITPAAPSICLGGNVVLTASGGTITNPAGIATIGTGTSTTNTAGITPFNSNWEGSRTQYIVRASELTATGLQAGNINSLAFDVSALGTGNFAQSGFTIKIAHTADAAFAGAYATASGSFATVYGPVSQGLPTLGIYTFTFSTPFVWDGTSNILLDICHDNDISATCTSCFSSSSTVRYTTTAYNSVYGRYNDNAAACGVNATSAVTTFTNRPNMLFGGTVVSSPTWLWSPATGLSATNTASVTAIPAVTTPYTAQATINGCSSQSTTTVTVNPVTVITVDAAPATQLVGQNTTATPLTVTATGTGTVTYQWFSNITNSNTGGTAVGTGASHAPSTADLGVLHYYAVATSDCGSATSSAVRVEVVNANTNFWTGTGGSNWSTPGSWSLSSVPTTLNDAVIPTGATPYPVLSATSTAKTLLMQSGTTVSLNGQTLNIVEGVDPTGTGTFIGSNTSNLSVGATSTLRFASGAGGEIKNLTINGGTATVATPLDITAGTALNTNGVVTVANGATLASGGNLTFKSNAFGTARLAQGATSGQWVTGDVTVERYIPGNAQRAWRFLSVPTKGTQTINQAWQEGATPANFNPKPNYGTRLTTPQAAYSVLGFDERTTKASIQFFNQASGTSGAWVDVSSTLNGGNRPVIESVKGYSVYVRGERTQAAAVPVTSTTPTTLRTRGTLYTGNQTTIAVGSGRFDLIGNTYVSPIDFIGLTRINIANSFYLWDPKLVVGTPPNQSLGGYVTFSLVNGWVGVPSSSSYGITPRTTIQSGESFMIQANAGGGSITLNESAKVAGNGINYFRPAAPTTGFEKMKANLFTVDAGGDVMADANVTVFDNMFSNAVDGDDAIKLSNAGENFAIRRGTTTLVVEGRQLITSYDTTFFWMWGLRQGVQYRLELLAENMNITGRTAFLIDNYTSTTTQLDLASGVTNYNFTINADNMSSTANRFRILYRQVAPAPVPVSFVTISANKAGNAVKVDWKVAAESGIRNYVVERSAEGRNFTGIGTVAANGNAGGEKAYAWTDATPLSEANFYRIKSVGIYGEIKYSAIVKVVSGNILPSFTIAPNPVEGSVVNVQFKNQGEGRYAFRLLAVTGEAVFTAIKEHAGGTATQVINLPASLARGAYQLEIISPDKTREVQTLFINTLK